MADKLVAMTEIDLDEEIKFNVPPAASFIDSIDSIEDFLDLSENTLDKQFILEKERIYNLPLPTFLPDDIDPHIYLDHLVTNAEHRLTVDLPMYLRQTALMAFVSAVEAATVKLVILTKRKFKIGKKIKGGNDTVRKLKLFNNHFNVGEGKFFDRYENLVIVRNFITHPIRKPEIDLAVKSLEPHFRIDKTLWLGDVDKTLWLGDEYIFIDRCGLRAHISEMKIFIPKLYEQAEGADLFSAVPLGKGKEG